MTRTDHVIQTWGGTQVLPVSAQIHAPQSLIPLLREGLPFGTLEHLLQVFALSRDEVIRILALPPRTLARRRQQQRLAPDESDRLYRLTRILVHAQDVFGDRAKVVAWLRRPNRALDGTAPLSLLDTDLVPNDFVAFAVDIPDTLPSDSISLGELPENWRDAYPPETCRRQGDHWLRTGTTAALWLPSAIIPIETNALLNPRHPDFGQLIIHPVEPFRFDHRLWRH